MRVNDYEDLLRKRRTYYDNSGFEPLWLPDYLFDFQTSLVDWALRKGRAAIFADCGLGKTVMQLVWARNVFQKTGKPVLLFTPIAVGRQTELEAVKFDIDAKCNRTGIAESEITITNYERLHHFDKTDFGGVVCDESSILKNFKGATRTAITDFLKGMPYRLLCTATAAPNDWHELGTSSEALGYLGFRDMITMFFKQETSKDHRGWGRTKYRFREHAKIAFWRWVSSWARACRMPSDLGFSNDDFILPPLHVDEEIVRRETPRQGMLFSVPAKTLNDQREERRATIAERCRRVSESINGDSAVAWCHLNDEGDELERVIPDAIQVSGRDSDDRKEDKLLAFSRGDERILITKPTIGAWGLNWQHCNFMTMFPSHSYEQYYQAVRRVYRFGQTRPVTVKIITTEGEAGVIKNMQRKSDQADAMFTELTKHMADAEAIESNDTFPIQERIPEWL